MEENEEEQINNAPSYASSAPVSGWESAMTDVIENEVAEVGQSSSDVKEVLGDFNQADHSTLTELAEPIGPPRTIIQSETPDVAPLITIDSAESRISSAPSGSSEEPNEGLVNGETPWLNVASSSSSQGSQGSYADQVPSLSVSQSTGHQVIEPTIEAKRSDLGSPWTLPEGSDKSSSTPSNEGDDPKDLDQVQVFLEKPLKVEPSKVTSAAPTSDEAPRTSAHVDDHSESFISAPEDEVTVNDCSQPATLEPNNTLNSIGIDEILGPKSGRQDGSDSRPSPAKPSEKSGRTDDVPDKKDEAVGFSHSERVANSGLSDSAPAGSPSKDSTLLAASQKEIDALTTKYIQQAETETKPEPTLAELQGEQPTNLIVDPFDRIVASLARHELNQTRPQKPIGEPARRQFIGPRNSVSPGSTFESEPSFQTSDSQTLTSTLNDSQTLTTAANEGAGSFWSASSRGDTLTHGETSISRASSRGDTLSQGETTMSRAGASVTSGSTMQTNTETNRTGLSYQDRSVGSGFVSQTFSGHTGAENTLSSHSTGALSHGTSMESGTLSQSRTEGSTIKLENTMTSRSGGALTMGASTISGTISRSDTEGSARKASQHPALSLSVSTDDSQGGRLWELASQEAEKSQNQPKSPESSRFAQSLMARTRSRADPDAVVGSGSMPDGDAAKPHMIRIGGQPDERFILNTSVARKRVRVVQLLIVGLLALLVSFLGTLWVQSSCHFVSAGVEVGDNGQVFQLHYGLWKYSPIDSAFQGYSYCYKYDDEYTADAPLYSRWVSCIAMLGGMFSLCALWAYLIFGRGSHKIWKAAVIAAAISGVLQLSTLSIFAGQVCSRDECSLGPAGLVSVLAGMVYFILAFEMHYNTPMAAWASGIGECPSAEQPGRLITNLEMTDFENGAEAYVRRIVVGDSNPYPTLNQVQRDNLSPMGESMINGELPSSPARSYKPPPFIV